MVMLRVGIVDYLSSLLRLGFGPSISSAPPSTTTPAKDAIQKRTSTATTQLLRFLSTHSAMSALSSVIAHSDAKLGAPSFVKAVSSRLLSAQLLRSEGVRSLFIITFGGADAAETAELGGKDEGTGTAAPGTNSLKRFEQCARLLLTPPQGMPIDVYLPIILPNLLDILAPDLSTSSNITPPPQEQMRAAGFVLTRISERHPKLFSQTMHDRVYSKFRPSMQAAVETQQTRSSAETQSASTVVVSAADLESAISTLSSFLLFSEPSPTFFTTLFEPILPQLLTLYNFVHAKQGGTGKGKVRSLESGGHADRLKAEVSNFLKTWVRLVDAKHGAQSLIQSVQTAEKGIGYRINGDVENARGDFFWSEEPEGVSVRYGQRPDQDDQDISTLLKDLSIAALAKQISTGDNNELDLTKIAPDLSAKLGLQPDPRLLAMLLKGADRKDLARHLLPSFLNVYMAIKATSRAQVVGAEDESGSETRSVLYLQLILQLLEAFGSDLLQGDVPATLAFIDFSLSSPSQRQAPPQMLQDKAAPNDENNTEIPFISAKPSNPPGSMPSLFDVAGKQQAGISSLEEGNEANTSKTAEDNEPTGDDEDEEELVTTALSLLLSLLESDTSLSSETQPMLLVIADKIESLLDSPSAEIRGLAKEAKLVLLARRNSLRSTAPAPATTTSETSAKALAYAQAQETYQEALKLLQDPILPVRAHGLVLLRRLVSDDPKAGGQHVVRVDPALIPAILDIFLHAVEDEESYLYLNAVQGLAALTSSGGAQPIARLVGIYIGRDDGLASQGLAAREVEKRLRVGEALLQVIQRCGDAMVAHFDAVVPPLLVKLRDRALPNVLRSSFVSILGTVIEAAPMAMARKGYAGQLAEVCIDIVVIEMVHRPNAGKETVKMNVQGKRVDANDEEKEQKRAEEQKKLDSATTSDAKVAHLRRAAMLLLTLLVRGTRFQLEEQDSSASGGRLVEKLSALRLPGGGILPSVAASGEGEAPKTERLQKKDLLFPPQLLDRLKQVAAYVEAGDTDSIVRTHAHDCIEHVDALSLDLVQSGLFLAR
uniref:RNA polymerase II assembly factor Rtp1 C-terminal domain-containing protein n=2 Tax=Kalmanozyma brasiliensis (strain GHG001) TaxID=1365824 RepID=V5ELY2_KALBG